MRRLRFLPALLMILSACSESIIEQRPSGSDQMGTVSVALSADMRNEIVASKADAEEPVLDDFVVSIYDKGTGKRRYNDSYANSEGRKIELPYGSYRLIAHHGDSLGFGFGKSYYKAEKEFDIKSLDSEVSAVAKLANVRLAVEFDSQTLDEAFEEYYAVIHHKDYTDKEVTFESDETRYGYIPGGKLILEVFVMTDGNWKSYKTDPETYNPNDFVTFKISAEAGEEGGDGPGGGGSGEGGSDEDGKDGNLRISISITTDTETVEHTVEIPAWAEDVDRPSITLSGFDLLGNVYEIVEGVETTNAMLTFIARGSVSSAVLKIQSDFLDKQGVPSEVDFADLKIEEKIALEDAGFDWSDNIKGSKTFSEIDFTGVIRNMFENTEAESQDVVLGEFFFEVKDPMDANALVSFKIISASIHPTLAVEDHNIWATKIVSPKATINKGDADLVKLQMSTDQATWTNVGGSPAIDGNTLTYGTVPASAGTTCYLRAIYNDNESCVSPNLTVRTEDAAQVGNAGFEDFQCVDFLYTPQAGSQRAEPWYLPWAAGSEDIWWDVNSKTTLRKSPTIAYQNYKCYPTVTYVVDNVHGGSKAAQVATVSTGQAASEIAKGSTYAGELFIGRSNDKHQDDWAYASTGHDFSSRPSALKFWYQYDSYEGENFYVKIEIRDASGNVIASAERSDIGGASAWTECSMPLTYKTQAVKASSIFITFKSSSDSSPETEKKKLTYYNSDDENHYVGSVLRVDDVELVY